MTLLSDLKQHTKLKKAKLSFGGDRTIDMIPTGCFPIDHALGGGVALGRVSEWFGNESTGKSLLGYLLLKEVQQRGGNAFLIDREEAYESSYFASLGGDPDKLIIPERKIALTAASCFEFIHSLCETVIKRRDKGAVEPTVVVLDSLAALSTKHLEKEGMEKVDMSKAKELSQGLRYITGVLAESQVGLVLVNQVIATIGSNDSATNTPGGKSPKFYSSQRLELRFDGGSATSQIVHEDNEVKVNGKPKQITIGRWSKGKTVKSRITSPLAEFRIPIYTRTDYPHPVFGTPVQNGIDRSEAAFEYLKSGGIRVNGELPLCQNGAWYSLCKRFDPEQKKFYAKTWPKVLAANEELEAFLGLGG